MLLYAIIMLLYCFFINLSFFIDINKKRKISSIIKYMIFEKQIFTI